MKRHYNLKELNAFHISTYADYFAEIASTQDLTALLANQEISDSRKYILGEGSSTLFASDFQGLVIKNAIAGRKVLSENNASVTLLLGAGEIWDEVVKYTVESGWGGIENMSFIPGTLGAAVVQNIAAYGQNFEDVFVELTAIELATGESKVFTKDECEFNYRDSIFKNKLKDNWCIVDVTIKLTTTYQLNNSYYSRYGSVEEELAKSAQKPYTLTDVRKAVGNIRATKFPDWRKFGTTGSYFKNPVVSGTKLKELQQLYPDLQYYPVDQLRYEKLGSVDPKSDVKIAAGWLLEELGWKGKRIGNVGTSPNQAMVIIGYDEVTAKEVLDFAGMMQADFKRHFGLSLEPEVNIVY